MYCVFNVFKDNFETNLALQTLFLPKTEAIKSVWQAFKNYVTVWLLYYFYCVALLYIICLCLSLYLVWRINVFTIKCANVRAVFAENKVRLHAQNNYDLRCFSSSSVLRHFAACCGRNVKMPRGAARTALDVNDLIWRFWLSTHPADGLSDSALAAGTARTIYPTLTSFDNFRFDCC